MTAGLRLETLSPSALARVIDGAPTEGFVVSGANRRALAARLGAVPTDRHRRIDAWLVERGGEPATPFEWTPAAARRILGNGALRRATSDRPVALRDAVRDEIDDLLCRVAAGRSRAGSLGAWLANRHPAELALVQACAVDWATGLAEVAVATAADWSVATADAYYDVERARTTLRARRDLVVGDGAVVVRLRAGLPRRSAGSGLRADLAAATFADLDGRAPRRYVGVWPDAGVILAVDGTDTSVRAGARVLVRAAIARSRLGGQLAA
ncbi:MAG: hypothetical protein KGJ92_00325 [Actinomycetales bacterium]|nr:hypothetical protein [Actinomycetales bacterium]